jgi:hypothetical protein
MGCGGMFIGVSFLIAGILSLIIESNVPILPSKGECHLRIYNPLNCTIKLNAPPKQVSRKTPRKTNDFSLFTVEPGIFLIGENESTEVKFHRGGTYTILIFFENGK